MDIPEWTTAAQLIRNLKGNQISLTVVSVEPVNLFGYIPGYLYEAREFINTLGLPRGLRADAIFERSGVGWRPVEVWLRTRLKPRNTYVSILFWREDGYSRVDDNG